MIIRKWARHKWQRFALCMWAIALLASGCFLSRNRSGSESSSTFVPPRPPAFLSGPMAVLLTNAAGFSGHVLLETRLPGRPPDTVSGDLLGLGTQLLFSGVPRTKAARSRGQEIFSWDVATGRGYVFNEALQGYAPLTSSLAVANIAVRPGSRPPEKIAGYRCESEEVTLGSTEGTAVYDVWRAPDLKGMPLRIDSPASPASFTLSLSNVRLEAPPAKIFLPPEGFTKYDSPEAMTAELITRQHNLKGNASPAFSGDQDFQPQTPSRGPR